MYFLGFPKKHPWVFIFGVGVNIKGEGIMQLFCMSAYISVSALATKFAVDFTGLHSV